jgi:murein hydrolase activator
MRRMPIYFICSLLYLSINHSYAASTQSELKQLNQHMLNIKQQLSKEKNTRHQHDQQLAKTEKKISDDLHATHLLTLKEKKIQTNIQTINQDIDALNQQLKQQEAILAKHLRTRHQLGNLQPWQWLFHQDGPQNLSRAFILYQYLFKADQRMIQQMRATHADLSTQHLALLEEQKKQHVLKAELLLKQKRLAQLKQKQQALINTLTQHIETQEEQLRTARHNKIRLHTLLKKLNARIQKKPLAQALMLEGKPLKTPLLNLPKQPKKLNNGLVFLAKEGTPVLSVLPGKVIFSDWLKGYGLLLIIDHGHHLISLYAHNASLFKSLGEPVEQGEQIATVGHTGGLRENGLYFEVRRRGRAVPPREWMA